MLSVQHAEAGKSDKILSRRTASLILTRGLGEYGLGFFVENLGDRTSFSHEGGTEGYRSQLYGYTRSGQGIVVMTNSNNGGALISEILASVAAEYSWPEFKVVEKVSIRAYPTVNKQAEGDYQQVNKPAHVVADGDRLYFQSELFGGIPMELFRESETAFFMTAQDLTIRFEQRADGAIIGFSLLRGTNTYSAKRTR